ncbi:MAG: chitobiase/beta-hexosaminidase C-terminal domain-containing protein [Planctomycetota bacterium]
MRTGHRQRITWHAFLAGAVIVAGGFMAECREEYPWRAAGNLATPRYCHTATLLPNGKVLVVGGSKGGGGFRILMDSEGLYLVSAELYDPRTNTWSAAASLATARDCHTATLLPSGKVLVVGGKSETSDNNLGYTTSVELYDPDTNTWGLAGHLTHARAWHTATLLKNGKVLVVGGHNCGGEEDHGILASAELYDPETNTWNTAGHLETGRFDHTATLLENGKVLAVGGHRYSHVLASVEVYDPVKNRWREVSSLATARFHHTATLLPSGNVLVAGGENYKHSSGHVSSSDYLSSAEVYDPGTNKWRAAGSLTMARFYHTATLLNSGNVLAVNPGGCIRYDDGDELYDPGTNRWTTTGRCHNSRGPHTATLLPSGKVLVAGDFRTHSPPSVYSAELYDPEANTETPTFSPPDGTYTSGQSVTISCATGGAGIYYTTDGTVPTTKSIKFWDPIPVSLTTKIKAIATSPERPASAVAAATYTINQTAAKLAFLGTIWDTIKGTAIADFRVAFQDANGFPVATATDPVTIGIETSTVAGKLSGTLTVNASGGIATFSGISIDLAGSGYKLNAEATGPAKGVSNSFSIACDDTTVATPTFGPAEGTYYKAQSVTISCATDGATIYYTTDGTVPTASSSVYAGALNVAATTTVKAVALNPGMTESSVPSATYTIEPLPNQVEPPTFSPSAGTYTKAQSVTISCATEGAAIYYTTDGATPPTGSVRYKKAINVSTTTTLKAIAVKPRMTNSVVASAKYTFE